MMLWTDWLKLGALLLALAVLMTTAAVALLWLCTAPAAQRGQPQRMVDIHNRGRTRLLMPDGTIK